MCVICRIRIEIKTGITTGTRRGIKTGNVAERTKRRVMKEMKGREIGSESPLLYGLLKIHKPEVP